MAGKSAPAANPLDCETTESGGAALDDPASCCLGFPAALRALDCSYPEPKKLMTTKIATKPIATKSRGPKSIHVVIGE